MKTITSQLAVLIYTHHTKILFGIALCITSFLLGSDLSMLGFILMADSTDDVGGPSDSSGSSDGGSGSPGCGYCDGGDSPTLTSTPYLYVKNKLGEYVMQNDIMVGSPHSCVHCQAAGEARIAAGLIGSDLYPFSLQEADLKNGLKLKIKEIEPEESFIYSLGVNFYKIPSGKKLIQQWQHENVVTVTEDAIQPLSGPVYLNNQSDVSRLFKMANTNTSHAALKADALRLEKGDTLTFTIAQTNQATQLLVSSFWRNWVAGEPAADIHSLEKKAATTLLSNISKQSLRIATKVTTSVAVLVGFIMGSSAVDGTAQKSVTNSGDESDLLSLVKKINKVAYADTPHTSLNISYKHPQLGMWVHYATVQPRAYLPTDIAVEIPKEAFTNDIAEIQIEATKAHYVKNVSVHMGVAEPAVAEEFQQFTKATKNDELISLKSTKEHSQALRMVAGDTLELKTDSLQEYYTDAALHIHGFYTPLSEKNENLRTQYREKLSNYEKNLVASYGTS